MNVHEMIPPHNHEAEQAVLGAMMIFPDVIPDVMEIVDYRHFYRPSHQTIYRHIERLVSCGEPIDAVTVANSLSEHGVLDQVGGRAELIELMNTVVIAENATHHSEIVREHAKLRKMVEVGRSVMTAGYEADPDSADSVIGQAASDIVQLSLDSVSDDADETHALMRDFIDMIHGGKRSHITPPALPMGRLEPGDLAIVAAGTSVGKTALSLWWADEWSKEYPVVYYEYEMPELKLLARLICKYAGVSMAQIQDGDLSQEEVERIEDAAIELGRRDLRVQEIWCNINTLTAKIRKDAMQGAKIVFIDHLGLVPFDIPKGMNFAKSVGFSVTNKLKRLASELNIIIVLLVQLNREGQHNPVAFPRLIHLRDSGEIEQDGAVVFTIWSDRGLKGDEYWAKRVEVRENCGVLTDEEIYSKDFDLIRVGIEKNRNGPLDEKFLLFYGDRFNFENRYEDVLTVRREPQQYELREDV